MITIRELGIRTAIWLTDDPYYTDITSTLVPHYDEMFTLERNSVAYYQQPLGCPRVHYLPFCVMPTQYRPVNPERSSRKEISFVGSAYLNRVEYFNQAAPYLATKNTLISGIWWDRLDQYELLASKIKLDNWMGPEKQLLPIMLPKSSLICIGRMMIRYSIAIIPAYLLPHRIPEPSKYALVLLCS